MRNWCEFFKEIEKDPTKIHSDLTVKNLVEARDHLSGCDTCNMRVERVLAKAPKSNDWASQN